MNRALQERQQQSLLDQARQQREGLSAKESSIFVGAPRGAAAEVETAPPAQSCRHINHVVLRGVDLLPDPLRQRVSQQADGECIDDQSLNHLLDELNDWYVENGYLTSHAWAPQDQVGDVLVIEAVEGRRGRLSFKDGTAGADRAARMAFPGASGEPLRLRDIEQGVDQLDRVTPGGVKVAVRAAAEEGYSDVVLTGRTSPSVNVMVSADNAGAKNTGQDEFSGAVALNNYLGFGEQLGVQASSTTALHGDRFRRDYGASASVPLGYWTFSYVAAAGSYSIPVSYEGAYLRYHGSSAQQLFTVSRTVERNAARKIDMFATVSGYSGRAWLGDSAINTSAERVRTARLGVNFATRVRVRSYFTVSPVFTQGLPFASRDMSASEGPPANFQKFAASASFYMQVGPDVALLSSAYAQASAKPLYSSERVSVGGETSVRGFKDQYLNGRTGAFMRNEVNWTVPLPGSAYRVTLLAAVDAGRVLPSAGEANPGGSIVGAAIGASTSSNGVSASLSLGKPIFTPRQLHADPVVLNLRLSAAF